MVTKVIACLHCGSDDVVKNGFAPNNGKQKYLCHACGRQSREDPSPNGYTQERKEEILRAYQERSSLTARCSRGEPMTTWLHEWLFRRSSREDCHCCKRWALQEPGGPHLRREPLLDQALREQS